MEYAGAGWNTLDGAGRTWPARGVIRSSSAPPMDVAYALLPHSVQIGHAKISSEFVAKQPIVGLEIQT